MAKESVKIHFREKIVELKFDEYEDEIDIDELTKIDYMNLFAEIITVPVLMNRVGIWKAQAEHDLANAKLDRDVYEANFAESYRKSAISITTDSKGNQKSKGPTKDEVDNAVKTDPKCINGRKRVIRLEKDVAYLDALYWAVKSKEKKLDKLIEKQQIIPEEFEGEIIEQRWNGILIKVHDKLIR